VGTSVGVFSARDSDVGQHLSFSIAENTLLSVNGVDLILNGNIDFEATDALKFNATVTDNGIPPLSVYRFTITTFTLSDHSNCYVLVFLLFKTLCALNLILNCEKGK